MTILTKEERRMYRIWGENEPYELIYKGGHMVSALDTIDALEAERDALRDALQSANPECSAALEAAHSEGALAELRAAEDALMAILKRARDFGGDSFHRLEDCEFFAHQALHQIEDFSTGLGASAADHADALLENERRKLDRIRTYATQQAIAYGETHRGRVLRRIAEMAGGEAVHTRRPESSVPPPTVQIRRDNEGDRGGEG